MREWIGRVVLAFVFAVLVRMVWAGPAETIYEPRAGLVVHRYLHWTELRRDAVIAVCDEANGVMIYFYRGVQGAAMAAVPGGCHR